MNVSIGERLESFVAQLVAEGRYNSNSEVVREGLRMVEEREAKLKALRETIHASISRGGSHTADEVEAASERRLDKWEKTKARPE
jgi:antitoxin ParD1/3/4